MHVGFLAGAQLSHAYFPFIVFIVSSQCKFRGMMPTRKVASMSFAIMAWHDTSPFVMA